MRTPKVKKPSAAELKAAQPVPLPDYNDAAVRKARADALKSLMSRRGRSSTILAMRSSGRATDVAQGGPKVQAGVIRG